jgi:hypothetical protein
VNGMTISDFAARFRGKRIRRKRRRKIRCEKCGRPHGARPNGADARCWRCYFENAREGGRRSVILWFGRWRNGIGFEVGDGFLVETCVKLTRKGKRFGLRYLGRRGHED